MSSRIQLETWDELVAQEQARKAAAADAKTQPPPPNAQTPRPEAQAPPALPYAIPKAGRGRRQALIVLAGAVAGGTLVTTLWLAFAPRVPRAAAPSPPDRVPAVALPEATAPAYSIFDQYHERTKRGFFVVLNNKPTEPELRRIVGEIMNLAPSAPRTYMWFYLKGAEVAKSAIWAYVAHDDRPEFEIRGFLPGDELAYLAKTFDLRNPVGTWLEDSDMGGLWAITDEDGTLYLSDFGRSGLRTSKRALTEVPGQDGRVFVRTEGSRAGEYYAMLPSGWLKIADNDGPIAMCKPVRVRAGDPP